MTIFDSLPTPSVRFQVEAGFVKTLSGVLALTVNWLVAADVSAAELDVIEADYKNFTQELVKHGWQVKLADYRLDNRGFVAIFELPQTTKSKGHVAFIGDFEFFTFDGNLYRARQTNALDIRGYRLGGRFEAPQHMIDAVLQQHQSFVG